MTTADETIRIIHDDDDLLVVSKPAGMMVHRERGPGGREAYLLQTVSDQVGAYLYPVHRLDRNTSGVLCFVRSSEMARSLQANLARAVKEYVVLARGETAAAFVSDRALTNDRGVKRDARTEFERLATFARSSLLLARISTGRRHQIRRHLNHAAHHVVGDTTHGKGGVNRYFRSEHGLPRMCLHARRIVIDHPRTGERMELIDPLPDDFRAFLLRLPDAPSALIDRL